MWDRDWQIQVFIRGMAWSKKLLKEEALFVSVSSEIRLCPGVCRGNHAACCLTLKVSESWMQGSSASTILSLVLIVQSLSALLGVRIKSWCAENWLNDRRVELDQQLWRFKFLRRTSSAGRFESASDVQLRSWEIMVPRSLKESAVATVVPSMVMKSSEEGPLLKPSPRSWGGPAQLFWPHQKQLVDHLCVSRKQQVVQHWSCDVLQRSQHQPLRGFYDHRRHGNRFSPPGLLWHIWSKGSSHSSAALLKTWVKASWGVGALFSRLKSWHTPAWPILTAGSWLLKGVSGDQGMQTVDWCQNQGG